MSTPASQVDQMVRAFGDALRTTERLEKQELASYQRRLLAQLLHHAHRNVPYYRERLAPLFRGRDIDFSRWRDIPILTRAEAQQEGAAMEARVLPPHAGKVKREVTSGSTGRPLDHLSNELVRVAALGLTDRVYRWWRLDGNRRLATFTSRRREMAPPPHGITSHEWRSGFPKGVNYIIDLWADTDVQIDWLLERRPHYLAAYSSTLPPLAQRVRERGLDIRFDKILSTATMVTDDIRKICKEVFGAPIIDQYGAQEVGHIAAQCATCGAYHVSTEAVYLEIVDEAGEPCGPGETGRVIVTSLYNYAMPFIRYEIGDYATVGRADLECRIKLPTLARVVGRYRNTFTLADGRVIYPYVAIERFRDFLSFSQVQVVQTDYDKLEVRYVAGAERRPHDAEGLQAYLRQAIDPGLSTTVTEVDAIARDPSGKFEDFLSLVPRPAIPK